MRIKELNEAAAAGTKVAVSRSGGYQRERERNARPAVVIGMRLHDHYVAIRYVDVAADASREEVVAARRVLDTWDEYNFWWTFYEAEERSCMEQLTELKKRPVISEEQWSRARRVAEAIGPGAIAMGQDGATFVRLTQATAELLASRLGMGITFANGDCDVHLSLPAGEQVVDLLKGVERD